MPWGMQSKTRIFLDLRFDVLDLRFEIADVAKMSRIKRRKSWRHLL